MALSDYSLDPSVRAANLQDLPDYRIASEVHNYGNGNAVSFDPETWATAATNLGKFAVASVVSGWNGIENTAVAVGNFFAGENTFQEASTAADLAALDSSLSMYYLENKQAVDAVGFIIGSTVGGMAGVKVLNAGLKVFQAAEATGIVGANLGTATGLINPTVDAYIAKAGIEIAQTSQAFSWLNAGVLKATAAGFGQAAVENAVFTTVGMAVNAKAPVLEDMDRGDIVSNILWGTGVGTVIGGAFNMAKVARGVKGAITTADDSTVFARAIDELQTENKNILPSDRILLWQGTLEKRLSPEARALMDDPSNPLYKKVQRDLQEMQSKVINLQGQALQEMAHGDAEISVALWNNIKGLAGKDMQQALYGATSIAKIGKETAEEFSFRKAAKKLVGLEGDEAADIIHDYGTRYVALTGEKAGQVFDKQPTVYRLADMHKDAATVQSIVKNSGNKISQVEFNPASLEISHLDVEKRFLWADDFADLKPGSTVGAADIPLLEKAYTAKLDSLTIKHADGTTEVLKSREEIYAALGNAKDEAIHSLRLSAIPEEEIAKRVNVSEKYLRGETGSELEANLLARQKAAADWEQRMVANSVDVSKTPKFGYQPSYVKVIYDTKLLEGADPMMANALTLIKARSKIYQQDVDVAVAKYAGDLADRLTLGTDEELLKANRFGAGATLFGFGNGNYGSLASLAESNGQVTSLLQKKLTDETIESLTTAVTRAAQDSDSMIEFAVINNRIASTPSSVRYVLVNLKEEFGEKLSLLPGLEGKTGQLGIGLIPDEQLQYYRNLVKGTPGLKVPQLAKDAPVFIPANREGTVEILKAHLERSDNHITRYQELRGAQGFPVTKRTGVFQPIHPSPKDYPYFALVVDDSVHGAGHVSMINASSAEDLEALIAKVPAGKNYKVLKKSDSMDFHKALGDYEYNRTLNENYINADLKREGINTQFIPATDPDLVAKRLLEYHTSADNMFARELVHAKLDKEFAYLRRQGERFGDIEASAYSTSTRYAESIAKNPYMDYIKTSLNISKANEYPMLQGFNQILDKGVSWVAQKATDAIFKARTPEELENVHRIFAEHGIMTGPHDAMAMMYANHTAPRGALNSFIRSANGLIATLVTRTDPLNAVNNQLGSLLMISTEGKHVIDALKAGKHEIVGKLAMQIPGTDMSQVTIGRLIKESYAELLSGKFGDDVTSKALMARFRANGWNNTILDQLRASFDDLALTGTESAPALRSKLASAHGRVKEILGTAADKMETVTGNRLSEETNRFVAARVMDKLTEPLVEAGKMTRAEADAYINTFVNRTQVNITASQRPLIFQGPVGHAIGLFQSYQFNILQQMFRYVQEGTAKDAAMLLGLQGTFFGLNGEPAFQYLNQHIVGTASGNKNHTDLYDLTYGVFGKQVGDFIMYGAPSALLGVNLYSRGDINPRQVTVIPVDPRDIPVVSVFTKTMNNLADAMGKVAGGGSYMQAFLQGLEHNGLSRPLAGIAVAAQGAVTPAGQSFSTTSKGSLLYANDLMSLANVYRVVGGKPLDEALANDALFRHSAYEAVDAKRKERLAETIKSTFAGGNAPTEDQVVEFAKAYAKIGGSQKQFNKFMLNQMKGVDTPKANLIVTGLKKPEAQSMQRIMGGQPFDTIDRTAQETGTETGE